MPAGRVTSWASSVEVQETGVMSLPSTVLPVIVSSAPATSVAPSVADTLSTVTGCVTIALVTVAPSPLTADA